MVPCESRKSRERPPGALSIFIETAKRTLYTRKTHSLRSVGTCTDRRPWPSCWSRSLLWPVYSNWLVIDDLLPAKMAMCHIRPVWHACKHIGQQAGQATCAANLLPPNLLSPNLLPPGLLRPSPLPNLRPSLLPNLRPSLLPNLRPSLLPNLLANLLANLANLLPILLRLGSRDGRGGGSRGR